MSQNKTDNRRKSVPSLSDEDIVTVNVDRRSFLSKVGLGSAGLGATLVAGCSSSDNCDTDTTVFDADPFDLTPRRTADACDTD